MSETNERQETVIIDGIEVALKSPNAGEAEDIEVVIEGASDED